MPSYLVACVRWHNAGAADSYGKMAVDSLRPFKGKYLARGAPVTTLEGAQAPERLAIVEFPDTKAVADWHASEEYAPARKLRAENADTFWIVIMEGVKP